MNNSTRYYLEKDDLIRPGRKIVVLAFINVVKSSDIKNEHLKRLKTKPEVQHKAIMYVLSPSNDVS